MNGPDAAAVGAPVSRIAAPATSRPVQLIRADSHEWDAWLAPVRRDIFHLAGYHKYALGSDEGDPYLLIVGNHDRGLAWPYLLRPVANIPGLASSSATEVHSVYGYPGPLAWGCEAGASFIEDAWSDIVDVWREQRAVTAFTRFHPLLDNAALLSGISVPGAPGQVSGGVVDGGKTVSVDLRFGRDAARGDYSRDIAREARAMRRLGMTTTHDVDWTELSTFAVLYRDTMIRSGAENYYFFTEADFRRLRDALAGRLHLLVTHLGETVTAAGLFTELDGLVEWYLVGTNEEYRHLSPAKLLVDDAIAWACDRGASVLHLGGGRGGRADTLLWFKSRFSSRRHAFHTGRWILDSRAYLELSQMRAATLTPGESLEATYFPLFRAQVITQPDQHSPRPRREVSMEVRRVGPDSAAALADLLPRIDVTYFQPHPMTAQEAHRIADMGGRDVYLVGYVGDVPVAYGMLRGWNEGFDVPSLGIGVRRDQERHGYGRAMINALHALAREGGAHEVRLRVHPDNLGARALYRDVGYREVGVERSEILMTVTV